MPTKHRELMVAGGYSVPHTDDRRAVKAAAALEAENQARIDAYAEAAAAAAVVAAGATAAKRKSQTARHQAELARARPRGRR